MGQITINNGDSGLVVRNALNGMFTELYGSIVTAIKIPGQNVTFMYSVPGNTFIHDIFIALANGSDPATVRLGSTPNGTEYTEDIEPSAAGLQVSLQQYFGVQTPVYITISGGTLNFRINQEANFY